MSSTCDEQRVILTSLISNTVGRYRTQNMWNVAVTWTDRLYTTDNIMTIYRNHALTVVKWKLLVNRWRQYLTTGLQTTESINFTVKPCPHCHRKVRLSQKTARQRRQSPNSATVALFCDSVDRLSDKSATTTSKAAHSIDWSVAIGYVLNSSIIT